MWVFKCESLKSAAMTRYLCFISSITMITMITMITHREKSQLLLWFKNRKIVLLTIIEAAKQKIFTKENILTAFLNFTNRAQFAILRKICQRK